MVQSSRRMRGGYQSTMDEASSRRMQKPKGKVTQISGAGGRLTDLLADASRARYGSPSFNAALAQW